MDMDTKSYNFSIISMTLKLNVAVRTRFYLCSAFAFEAHQRDCISLATEEKELKVAIFVFHRDFLIFLLLLLQNKQNILSISQISVRLLASMWVIKGTELFDDPQMSPESRSENHNSADV